MSARILLFALLLPLPAQAMWPQDFRCVEDGKIRYVLKGSPREEAAAYCFSSDHSYFFAPACKRGKGCAALDKDELGKVPDTALLGRLGSPGFKLCRAVGGNPELLEYSDGEKWWTADRCVFSVDSSFVDTGILVRKRAEADKNRQKQSRKSMKPWD